MENESKNVRSSIVEEDIQRLRTWLQKQPHMPKEIDDKLLLPFIRGTKSIEIAKQKLETFCMMHSKYPDSFSFQYRDPLDPQFKERRKMGKMFILPGTTPEGYRVLMGISLDFSKFDGFWNNVIMTMILETSMIMHPETLGLVITFDCKLVDSSIMTKMGIPPMAFLFQYLQSAIPMRMKRMIVYNTPSFFDVFIHTFVKPYVKKKLFERVIFSSKGNEVLKEYLPLDILPCDIEGGKAPSTDEIDAEWKRILESRRDWFKKTAALAIDEAKRLPSPSHCFGVDGTFRALSVD